MRLKSHRVLEVFVDECLAFVARRHLRESHECIVRIAIFGHVFPGLRPPASPKPRRVLRSLGCANGALSEFYCVTQLTRVVFKRCAAAPSSHSANSALAEQESQPKFTRPSHLVHFFGSFFRCLSAAFRSISRTGLDRQAHDIAPAIHAQNNSIRCDTRPHIGPGEIEVPSKKRDKRNGRRSTAGASPAASSAVARPAPGPMPKPWPL